MYLHHLLINIHAVEVSSISLEEGDCFLPDTLQAHASYAFNSFYTHAFLAPGACDFAGTAVVAKTDPSYGTCVYPGSPSTAKGTEGMSSPTPGATLPPPQNGTPMDGSVGALTPADMNMNGTTLNGSTGAVTPTGMMDSSSSSKAFSGLSVSSEDSDIISTARKIDSGISITETMEESEELHDKDIDPVSTAHPNLAEKNDEDNAMSNIKENEEALREYASWPEHHRELFMKLLHKVHKGELLADCG
ncbi:plasmodesmata callose-binding protein 3-like protein [Tanacetum coccineum]